MNDSTIDTVIRFASGVPSRRHLLRGLAVAGLGLGVIRLPGSAEAKKQRTRKPKSTKGLCQKNGAPCTRPGKRCNKKYCLRAPFTIEAKWTEAADHDTYLFVPPRDETTGPAPYIYSNCTQAISRCEEAYPFACVDNEETQAGDEVTTIYERLPGNYEYWLGLDTTTPAGAVTVLLKAADGRIVRQWASPANPSPQIQAAWHVFDIDGRDGRVTAIDELIADRPPGAVYQPDTNVCPTFL